MEDLNAHQYSNEYLRIENDHRILKDLLNSCHPIFTSLLKKTTEEANDILQVCKTLDYKGIKLCQLS